MKPNQKLTDEQVEAIRAERHTKGTLQSELADRYGVSRMCINDLLHYRTHKPF